MVVEYGRPTLGSFPSPSYPECPVHPGAATEMGRRASHGSMSGLLRTPICFDMWCVSASVSMLPAIKRNRGDTVLGTVELTNGNSSS